jgi:hypothetical protein
MSIYTAPEKPQVPTVDATKLLDEHIKRVEEGGENPYAWQRSTTTVENTPVTYDVAPKPKASLPERITALLERMEKRRPQSE